MAAHSLHHLDLAHSQALNWALVLLGTLLASGWGLRARPTLLGWLVFVPGGKTSIWK